MRKKAGRNRRRVAGYVVSAFAGQHDPAPIFRRTFREMRDADAFRRECLARIGRGEPGAGAVVRSDYLWEEIG